MSQYFVLLGSNDRKIKLENATHPCPRCKKPDTVQLTRYENEWIVFNRRVALPNNMNVRYECNQCKWKNQILPEGDPSDKLTPSDDEDVDYLSATNYMFVGPKTLTNQTASSSNSSISSNSSNSSNLTSKPYSASLYQPSASRSTTSWKQRSLFMKRASCST